MAGTRPKASQAATSKKRQWKNEEAKKNEENAEPRYVVVNQPLMNNSEKNGTIVNHNRKQTMTSDGVHSSLIDYMNVNTLKEVRTAGAYEGRLDGVDVAADEL